MTKNGFASLVRQRSSGQTKRRRLDDYETPVDTTCVLTRTVRFKGPILEPACGSGRMVRALRDETGCKVFGFDIKKGDDFLLRTRRWAGDIVTNPPYRDELAERFCRHALWLAEGRVCMLVQSGFLWGSARAKGLFSEIKPDLIIIHPERIYFYEAGRPIKSQFYSHAWLCWPERRKRERFNYETVTKWVSAIPDF